MSDDFTTKSVGISNGSNEEFYSLPQIKEFFDPLSRFESVGSDELEVAPRQPRRRSQGYVYFIACHEMGWIKIGYSTDMQKRMHNLLTATPHDLKLVEKFPGTEKDEANLHARFAKHRIKREWFRYHIDISNTIWALRKARRGEEHLRDTLERVDKYDLVLEHAKPRVWARQRKAASNTPSR